MKTYYTYAEYLEMFPNRTGFEYDLLSRHIASCFLQNSIPASDIFFTEGNNCTDIVYRNRKGEMVAAECKDRLIKSDDFGDMFIEEIKLDALKRRKANGEFSRIQLFCFYRDGMICLEDQIDDENVIIGREVKLCNDQTMVDPEHRVKIPKDVVLYRQAYKWYFIFKYNPNGNKWELLFSTDPFNIQQMNRDAELQARLSTLLF